MKIAVVGAGITGCTIANLLSNLIDKTSNRLYDIDLYESTDTIGGACQDTIEDNAYLQVHGSHIFHTKNKEVWDYLSQFTHWLPYQHKVKALVNGYYVPVPFNYTSLEILYPEEAQQVKDALMYGQEYTFEKLQSLNNELLNSLAYNIFTQIFKNYSKKQWNKDIKPEDIKRVKAYRSSYDDNYFSNQMQGIPLQGFNVMFNKMIYNSNISLKLETVFSLNDVSLYDYVFYTGSIDQLFDYQFGQLPYRSCTFVSVLTEASHVFDRPVTNFPNDYDYTRVHDYSYYLPSSNKSWCALEYPCDYTEGVNERYYPLKEGIDLYSKYFDYSKENYPNIMYVGRLGTYRYLDMDAAVYDAMTTVKDFTNMLKEKVNS